MVELSPIDLSKPDLKYLGWGVDCRSKNLEEDLEFYDGPQIRDIDGDDKNVNIIHCSEDVKVTVSKKSGDKFKTALKYRNYIKVSCVAGKSTEDSHNKRCKSVKTATYHDDIRRDPGVITMKDEDGQMYTFAKFEEVLSQYVLDYIKEQQEDRTDGKYLGKLVSSLVGGNAIAKLRYFTQDDRCRELDQVLIDACSHFIDSKVGCTHYVCGIKVGTEWSEVNRNDATRTFEGNMEIAGIELNAGANGRNQQTQEICTHGNTQIVKKKLKPLFTLINPKSKNIRKIMEKLSESYTEITLDDLSGPYTISCHVRNEVHDRVIEEVVYWQVTAKQEISATTCRTNASEFYLQYLPPKESPRFHIIYKSSHGTKSNVKCKNWEDGLKLVQSAHIEDTFFMLEKRTRQDAKLLPATPHDLAKQGPFFIKQFVKPQTRYRLLYCMHYVVQYLVTYFKPIKYIAVGPRIMGSQERSMSSRSKIDDKHKHEMLFYMNYKYANVKAESMLYLERDVEETSTSFLNVNAKETTCTCRTSVVLAIVLCLIAMVASVVAHVF